MGRRVADGGHPGPPRLLFIDLSLLRYFPHALTFLTAVAPAAPLSALCFLYATAEVLYSSLAPVGDGTMDGGCSPELVGSVDGARCGVRLRDAIERGGNADGGEQGPCDGVGPLEGDDGGGAPMSSGRGGLGARHVLRGGLIVAALCRWVLQCGGIHDAPERAGAMGGKEISGNGGGCGEGQGAWGDGESAEARWSWGGVGYGVHIGVCIETVKDLGYFDVGVFVVHLSKTAEMLGFDSLNSTHGKRRISIGLDTGLSKLRPQ